MKGRIIFVIVTAVVFVSVFSLDRWGQVAFIKLTMSAFIPTNEKQESTERPQAISRNKSVYFPTNFLIGTSSSAYQIEGGWNEDGKSPSIWDDFVHLHPQSTADNSTADVGPDSYHRYKEDIEALKLVGVSLTISVFAMTHFNRLNKVPALSLLNIMDQNRFKRVS